MREGEESENSIHPFQEPELAGGRVGDRFDGSSVPGRRHLRDHGPDGRGKEHHPRRPVPGAVWSYTSTKNDQRDQ